MERGKKRRRNVDLPRLTYHASDRTFERLFKEESLGEMKAVVRRKLGLPEDASICLAQLREGKPIDLEDDDDFEAFYSIAHSMSSVNVSVTMIADATPSPGAAKALTKKKKKKKDDITVLAGNTSLELPPNVVGNEHIVLEDEITLCAAEETDTRKRQSSLVRSSGNNDASETTGEPRKKKKVRSEGTDALQVLLACQLDGKESTVLTVAPLDPSAASVSAPQTTTIASDQGSGKSQSAKRKKRQDLPSAEPALEPVLCPTTLEGDSMMKRRNKDFSKAQDAIFPEQLAGAISEMTEHNQKRVENLPRTSTGRRGKKQKKLSTAEDKDGVIGDSKRKASGKFKASTTDELEAASADVKAAFSRILAAKRASLSSSLVDNSLAQHSEDRDIPPKVRRSEAVALKSTLSRKSDTQYPIVTAEPSPSRVLIAEGAPKAHPGVSDLTTRRSSSRSSNDESEDQGGLGPMILPIVPTDASSYANIDLDALIRGPKISVKVLADVPSTGSSENEQGLDLSEDDEDRGGRRRARRTVVSDSSEEKSTDDNDDDCLDEDQRTSLILHSRSSSSPHPDVDYVNFRLVDRLGESQEVDVSGDVAFHAALAADTAVFKLADHGDPAPSVLNCVLNTASNNSTVVQSSEGSVCLADSTDNSLQTEFPSLRRSPRHDTSVAVSEGESPEKQRREGIIRRMKGRSSKILGKNSAPGSPAKYERPRELIPESSISMNDNCREYSHQSLSQQANEIDIGVTIGTEASSQKSLDTWTTLRASSPLPDVESTIMIDELRSSSPESHFLGKADSKPSLASGTIPLFVLTESQLPSPYSQWESPGDQHAQDDYEDEQEVQASIQSQSRSKTIHPPKYRRLTDIASQRTFFSTPTPNIQPARFSGNRLADLYGRSGEDIESESDTDTDSNPDAQVDSHIPKSRIAGITRQTSSEQVIKR